MEVIVPVDGMELRRSCTLAEGVYYCPSGLRITTPGITIIGHGVTLIGATGQGIGLDITANNITIKGLSIKGYQHGIRAISVERLVLDHCSVHGTAEIASNTVFLDIWLPSERAYGGGVLLVGCDDCEVVSCDLQHQQTGLMAYGCRRLAVTLTNASYCSGFGFYLSATSDSRFEENIADYCCRFEPREGGLHFGHMGADAAGFVLVRGSSRNVFRRNAARLGGDGFFLAGLDPSGKPDGCDDNLFEDNDGSLSPNIAFEATFCRGNIFRRNYADRSNYGFWLGYSWDTMLESNRMIMNRQAGIAVENGHHFNVIDNTFQGNGHGILLWSGRVEGFARLYPESLTSWDWQIEGNTMTRNGRGVRIANNQDHGIRSGPEATSTAPDIRPRGHLLRRNDIQDNRIGIELVGADGTIVEGNILNRNVEANIREDDTTGTLARNNLGSRGAYL